MLRTYQDVVQSSNGRRHSRLGVFLKSKGIGIWDAVDSEERITEPESVDQIRIVQYDSARGLEGWLVIAKDFDRFYNNKLLAWKPPSFSSGQQARFVDIAFEKDMFAARWAMIAMTRAIDTLIISLSNPTSNFARAILDVSEEHARQHYNRYVTQPIAVSQILQLTSLKSARPRQRGPKQRNLRGASQCGSAAYVNVRVDRRAFDDIA